MVENVVLLHADTLRADHLGAYGADIHTPNLDRLAAAGTVFERSYAASYPTVPNRHDLWTGRYNFLQRGWVDLQPEERTLPEMLDGTGVTSKFVFDTPMLQGAGFHQGFDGWHRERGHHGDPMRTAPRDPELPAAPHKISRLEPCRRYLRNSEPWECEREFIAPRTMAAAAEWLEDNRGEGPFCLVVDTWDPHEPFDAPDHHVERYDDTPDGTEEVIYPAYGRPGYLTDAEHDHVRARYRAEVSMVDHAVGRVLDALDRLGLRDDTLVLFTSDHGHLFGEHDLQGKPTGSLGRLYEESIHTPLLVDDPDGVADRVEALVQPPDVLPTVLDALGLSIPDGVQGHSLLGLLRGDADAPDALREYAVTARYTEGADTDAADFDGWRGQGGVVNPVTVTGERWAYVCHPDPAASELYDLDADPGQSENVREDHPAVAERLREQYLAFCRDRDGAAVMREPFDPGSDYASREAVAPGTAVYYFEYGGDRFGHVDRAFAERRCPAGADVEETTFGTFVEETPQALVNVEAQYYYAAELAE